MGKKQNAPKVSEKIEPSAIEISVASNSSLKPYIACFEQKPDNVAKEPLGMLAGVFAIGDRSEDSAYIVNFLSSLAKKEYYGNPRRNPMESFEASLHKVNLGLSELAKEGNTKWIGTLNAAVCVIERSNMHFSVAGNAKVFLFREQRLSDISEGLADENDLHPMKTFTDVASGKIHTGDRILLTTPELFSVISRDELERAANRLHGEALERFLRTAIINKLDLCAVLSIDIRAVEVRKKEKIESKRILASPESIPNAWSQTVFEDPCINEKSIDTHLHEKTSLESEKERVDDKTGHIYVTGETPIETKSEFQERLSLLLGDMKVTIIRTASNISRNTLSGIKKTSSSIATTGVSTFETMKRSAITWNERRLVRRQEQEQNTLEKTEKEKLSSPSEVKTVETKKQRTSQSFTMFSQETLRIVQSIPRPSFPRRDTVHVPVQDKASIYSHIVTFFQTFLAQARIIIAPAFRKIVNTTQRARKKGLDVFQTLNQKQKMIVVGVGIILIITIVSIPFLLTKKSISITTPTPVSTIPIPKNPLEHEPNIHMLDSVTVKSIYTNENIISIISLDENAYAVEQDAVVTIGSGEPVRTNYPDGARATRATTMPTLGIIFILTDKGTLLSYLPATKKFESTTIALPEKDSIADMATTSTYLYILDADKDAIFRFPRATGGFGNSLSWLKEQTTIEKTTHIAVSESLFLMDASGLQAYARGTKQSITFAPSTIPVSFDALYTDESGTSIFVLDGKNGRVVEYDKTSGAIIAQYASDQFKGATDFTIVTTTKTAFIQNGRNIIKAELK